ncbi:unnamed protein product [Acanthoscelides obtectus]|uniref:Uncharacterized protein n=1 Tax=Acanthoscelides obtectus TaxID=200917 RepID=A0A9P0JGY5_ACAOB|nr:unnamed protein product [Acanthoscelides obtectus]CAK1625049.1 hypothetical protein AOBTE_LOCUS2911 [Acanthoscelides obtectus]
MEPLFNLDDYGKLSREPPPGSCWMEFATADTKFSEKRISWAGENSNNTQDTTTYINSESTTNNSESESSNHHSSRPPKPSKSKRLDDSIANEVLVSVRDHFKRPRTEDRCDLIGKNVAIKLRALDAKQILVAEKLINDLLFEAEIGHLTPDHAYISMRDVLKQNNQRNYVHGTYTPVSFVASGNPSPPCLPVPSQHSEQLLPTSRLLNSHHVIPYSQMQTPTLSRNQPGETEVLVSIPDSAASFVTTFNADT